MNYNRILIYAMSVCIVLGSLSCKKQTKQRKPNILLLLADDLGYNELGCYGQDSIQTPVLDKLAAEGMRFTDFYAGSAVCAPSRAVLMTGIPSTYNTIRGNKGKFDQDGWMRVALKKEELTIGEMVREAGYQTGFIGKWHLGVPEKLSTWAYNRGFDYAIQEQWGISSAGRTFDEDMHWVNGMQDSVYYHFDEWESKDDFRTSLACDYLNTINKEKPFFLFMSYRAPHGHERKIGNMSLYADENWPKAEKLHASKITLLDKHIGRLLDKLESMGELENTLVLFTSDNGPHCETLGHELEFFDGNGDLRGHKRDVYEGGIRVPLIAYWKGKIMSGSVTGHISGFQDIMSTLADIIDTEPSELNKGCSFLPVLLGKQQDKHDFLNWEFHLINNKSKVGVRQSARVGQWKGVRYGSESEVQLYNLSNDIGEQNNVADQHPEVVKQMKELFEIRSHADGFAVE